MMIINSIFFNGILKKLTRAEVPVINIPCTMTTHVIPSGHHTGCLVQDVIFLPLFNHTVYTTNTV